MPDVTQASSENMKFHLLRPACLAALAMAGAATSARADLSLANINNPVAGARVNNPDGSFTIIGGGGDTWDNADSFTYAYEERSGDFDVQVRVVNLVLGDTVQQDSAKASIMARAGLTPGAANVQINALATDPKNAIESIYRPVADAGTDDMPDRPSGNTSGATPYPDVWLRLRRVGNHFTTFYSNKAGEWTVLSAVAVDPAQFPQNLLIGLSTVNHISGSEDASLRVQATYKDFSNTPVPPLTIIDGAPAGDKAPGTFPNASVTGVNWKIVVPADGLGPNGSPIHYNGANKNEYILSVDGQGPISWSAPGYNQGDIDFDLGPRDPVAALENTGPYGPKYNRAVTDPAAAPAQAWAPSPRDGIVLGSIRKLSQQWNDGAPAFHGFLFCPTFEGASRKGFSTLDGAFRNMDYYFSFVKLGETASSLPADASPAALREANIDLSMAWFPYAAGWKAGYVSAPNGSANGVWRAHATQSPALTSDITVKNSAAEIVQWADDGNGSFGGRAQVKIPGVNTASDGMLFTISTDDSTDNRGAFITAAPAADGSAWNVAIRIDDEEHSPSVYADDGQSDFAFLYVPYTAPGLVGGKVAANGTKAGGSSGFTVARASAGRYEITIPGKTAQDGMLLLQNAGYLNASEGLTDDGVLAWEYINGKFVVEARHAEAGTSGFDVFPTRDTDFYFVWVDFTQPLKARQETIPSLAIERTGNNLLISWPANISGFTLESAPAVHGPWTTVAGANNNQLTVTPSATTLYRLRK
jgi:hypothetical protein